MNKAPKKPEKHDPDETVKITPEQVEKPKTRLEQIERAVYDGMGPAGEEARAKK
jgi:hypothetical protein